MKLRNPFNDLTRFERVLWGISFTVVLLSFIVSGSGDYLTLAASLVGVTALIFLARGFVLGQALIVCFSVLYGIISFVFGYYGEMITYVFMTAPSAVVSLISWIRHPFEGTKEVKVGKMSVTEAILMLVFSAVVTAIFYFVLKFLNTENLFFSTISVTTSFLASYLTFRRSPFYALGYAANDVVLIVLWVLASIESISYVPMVLCFVMFLVNDIYGFISWRRMEKRQNECEKSSF